MKPLLLDLFCKAGGCSKGYSLAGFDCVGVDIEPQKNYPYRFIQTDALDFLRWLIFDTSRYGPSWGFWQLTDFKVIHASPPFQAFSVLKHLTTKKHPELIVPVRELLIQTGLPYIIENVVGAPLINPVQLCGSSFGLDLRRHRLFESNMPLVGKPCDHDNHPCPIDVSGTGGRRINGRKDGCGGNSRKPKNLAHARLAMGIDWMTRIELAQAIPPKYTEFLGKQAIKYLKNQNH